MDGWANIFASIHNLSRCRVRREAESVPESELGINTSFLMKGLNEFENEI
jgi:hypothetical protein